MNQTQTARLTFVTPESGRTRRTVIDGTRAHRISQGVLGTRLGIHRSRGTEGPCGTLAGAHSVLRTRVGDGVGVGRSAKRRVVVRAGQTEVARRAVARYHAISTEQEIMSSHGQRAYDNITTILIDLLMITSSEVR